ncbi:hypothetical protein GCM10007880_58450 [Mesorhizobium amorphae]|nr:hypothetical protein GCM10007880_58450 [Mesorhizobium amorphae]
MRLCASQQMLLMPHPRRGRRARRNGEKIRRTGEIVGCIAVAGVTEICGQQRKRRLNVCTLLMPKAETGHGEPVREIVWP